MSEESTEIAVQPEVLPAETKPETPAKLAKTLREEIRDILVITFVCESSHLRQGNPTLPIDQCLKVYRSNPLVFYYINKQLDHVMKTIERHAKQQG